MITRPSRYALIRMLTCALATALPVAGAAAQGGDAFTSVEQLKEHIDAFIDAFIGTYNEDVEPFVWTKSKVHQRRVKGRRLSDL